MRRAADDDGDGDYGGDDGCASAAPVGSRGKFFVAEIVQ